MSKIGESGKNDESGESGEIDENGEKNENGKDKKDKEQIRLRTLEDIDKYVNNLISSLLDPLNPKNLEDNSKSESQISTPVSTPVSKPLISPEPENKKPKEKEIKEIRHTKNNVAPIAPESGPNYFVDYVESVESVEPLLIEPEPTAPVAPPLNTMSIEIDELKKFKDRFLQLTADKSTDDEELKKISETLTNTAFEGISKKIFLPKKRTMSNSETSELHKILNQNKTVCSELISTILITYKNFKPNCKFDPYEMSKLQSNNYVNLIIESIEGVYLILGVNIDTQHLSYTVNIIEHAFLAKIQEIKDLKDPRKICGILDNLIQKPFRNTLIAGLIKYSQQEAKNLPLHESEYIKGLKILLEKNKKDRKEPDTETLQKIIKRFTTIFVYKDILYDMIPQSIKESVQLCESLLLKILKKQKNDKNDKYDMSQLELQTKNFADIIKNTILFIKEELDKGKLDKGIPEALTSGINEINSIFREKIGIKDDIDTDTLNHLLSNNFKMKTFIKAYRIISDKLYQLNNPTPKKSPLTDNKSPLEIKNPPIEPGQGAPSISLTNSPKDKIKLINTEIPNKEFEQLLKGTIKSQVSGQVPKQGLGSIKKDEQKQIKDMIEKQLNFNNRTTYYAQERAVLINDNESPNEVETLIIEMFGKDYYTNTIFQNIFGSFTCIFIIYKNHIVLNEGSENPNSYRGNFEFINFDENIQKMIEFSKIFLKKIFEYFNIIKDQPTEATKFYSEFIINIINEFDKFLVILNDSSNDKKDQAVNKYIDNFNPYKKKI